MGGESGDINEQLSALDKNKAEFALKISANDEKLLKSAQISPRTRTNFPHSKKKM
ncbi:MAG: hypothetical protein L6V93_06830 [Clostridiales bacterium]|nr:MAG: hypothetical protein L6V93_06830 [Clostridiales bacterium]